MKNSIFSLLFFGLSLVGFAQKEVPSPEQIKQFKATTTLVVLDENPFMSYNFKIKEALKKIWTITPFEYISPKEYEEKRKSDQYSFITFDQVWFSKDKTQAQYNFLCLSLGGNYKKQDEMPQLCTVPVSYAEVEEESYIYKLSALLYIVQNHIKFIESNPHISDINVEKKYNENAYLIKTKELYIIPEELSKDINTEAKFKKIYPYPFKFVTRDVLEKAIDSKMPNIVFLHKVGPEGTKKKARCYKTIIGTEHNKLYYFDYHMIDSQSPDGLLAKDLKKIANSKE